MVSDRELLELAAKALGWRLAAYDARGTSVVPGGSAVVVADGRAFGWRPLTDDGDALRLAVKLKLKVTVGNGITMVEHPRIPDVGAEFYEGAEAATRRAIVRAAAEIGRRME